MDHARFRFAFAALLLLLLAACNKEKLDELAGKAKQVVSEGTDKVKQQVGVATETAKEQLAMAGGCEVALDTPVATTACYFTFLPQGSGRPGVLQVRSYREVGQESFPSIMLQSQVKAGGLSELVGQTVSAQMFVQKAQDAPVWFCPPGAHVDLKVVSVDEKSLNGEIVGGSVRNSQSGQDQTITGKFTSVPH